MIISSFNSNYNSNDLTNEVYKQKIEKSDINIVPPERTVYLSKEYSFTYFVEIQYFIDLARQQIFDSLKIKVKTILNKLYRNRQRLYIFPYEHGNLK